MTYTSSTGLQHSITAAYSGGSAFASRDGSLTISQQPQ
jgi:hypothetical protein